MADGNLGPQLRVGERSVSKLLSMEFITCDGHYVIGCFKSTNWISNSSPIFNLMSFP